MATQADKKKKQQMIILAVLGVVVVIVAVMNLPGLFSGGAQPAPPKPPEGGGTPTPAGSTAAAGTTGSGTPGAPGAPGASTPEQDIAELKLEPPVIQTVSFNPGSFDPLLVLNSDIVDERRAEEVLTLKQNWVLKGVASRMYELKDADGQLVFDDDGRVKMVEVYEVFFDGKAYPYKVGDRLLPGTRFKISKIIHNRDGATVEVTSDTGATQRLKIASFDPYPEESGK